MMMRLRPHHLLDIISQYGAGAPFRPSAYGHAVHSVAEQVIADPDVTVEFVVDADEICAPCKHLADGKCDDVFDAPQLLEGLHLKGDATDGPTTTMKQDYNDDLDRRVLAFFGMSEGDVMTFGAYVQVVRDHIDGLEQVCTHPREDPDKRLATLTAGLEKLGRTQSG